MDALLKQREELQKQLDAKLEANSSVEEVEGDQQEEERGGVISEQEVKRKVRDKTPPTGTHNISLHVRGSPKCTTILPTLGILAYGRFIGVTTAR